MSSRARWAGVILAVWAATLGFHVKRLYFRSSADLLAEAARTLPPGTAYYAVLQADRQIGWAQTDIDTLPGASGFRLREQLVLRESPFPGGEPTRLATEATLGPTFALRRFFLDAQGIAGIRQVEGVVQGDSILELTFRGTGETRTRRVELDRPIVVAAAWPLRFAAQRGVRPGDELELAVFDPLSGATRNVHFSVREEALRSYPDSVMAADGHWIPARRDTVRAWRVEHDLSGIPLESWVDEDGRLLEAHTLGDVRLVRTAFELAYFGEKVPQRISTPGASPAAEAKEGSSR